jgi:FixJ family two-component response regulator
MDTAPTVYLVDDDPAFLTAMARYLRAAGFAVASFASAAELLSRVTKQTRGCVVADLAMPGVSGLELQVMLAERDVAMPMVFLTGHADIPSSVCAMRGGAIDFLEKLAPKDQLLTAISYALERDAEAYAARLRLEERRQRLAALTQREREVLALVVRGKMNKQIAAVLGIHERTVKLHRTAITTKLGVHAVAQLAILATEARLVEPAAASVLGR